MKMNGNRSGFSMIEVLVASAILIVIIMMLAMLFQQTSLSWRTGIRRADAYMQIRSGIGAIQRDASAAVDARTIPAALKTKLGGGSQQFSGGLRFYTLTGEGFYDANNNGKVDSGESMPYRALTYVTYNSSGDRTETTLMADGNKETTQGNVLDFITKASSGNKPVTQIKQFDPVFGSDNQGLPLFVNIRARVTSSGSSLDIGAASAGPDKTWNTKDDIKTWVGNP